MADELMKNEVDVFLAHVVKMAVEGFETVDDAATTASFVKGDSRRLMKLSAALHAWIDKRVRDALSPLESSLPWPPSLYKKSVFTVEAAAQAIVRRDRLSAEPYEAYVRGFRAVGLKVPVHPSPDGQNWASGTPALADAAKSDVEGFLDQVAQMTVEGFDTVASPGYSAPLVRKQCTHLLMMPAADFGLVEAQVRGTLRPLLVSLPWPSEGGVKSLVVRLTLRAVEAIVRRDRLDAEQYEAFMGGFRAAGLTIPPGASAR